MMYVIATEKSSWRNMWGTVRLLKSWDFEGMDHLYAYDMCDIWMTGVSVIR